MSIDSAYLLIAMVGFIVYLTRVGGYFVGLRLRHIPGIQTVLETLPGCAFMALLVPAVSQGSPSEWLAFAIVVVVMWFTDNVVVATILGIACLLLADHLPIAQLS